jgi:hypothetical protein
MQASRLGRELALSEQFVMLETMASFLDGIFT